MHFLFVWSFLLHVKPAPNAWCYLPFVWIFQFQLHSEAAPSVWWYLVPSLVPFVWNFLLLQCLHAVLEVAPCSTLFTSLFPFVRSTILCKYPFLVKNKSTTTTCESHFGNEQWMFICSGSCLFQREVEGTKPYRLTPSKLLTVRFCTASTWLPQTEKSCK